MSSIAVLVLVLIAVVISIVVGRKRNINLGILAIGFAYIIGNLLLKFSVTEVVAGFPTSTVFLLLTTCLFYGFAMENGTISVLAGHMVYATRKAPWALIPLLGLVALCISNGSRAAGGSYACSANRI